MNRYFVYLAFKGTNYCGWQRQPNGLSVQQCVEDALSTVLRRTVPVVGAGRTDAGVHAKLMVAHFDSETVLAEPAGLAGKLNRLLPPDIAVDQIIPVKAHAHARFDALSRTYRYVITGKKDPFNSEWVHRMATGNLDFEQMNRACKILSEYTDFTSFSKLHTDVKTNNCRIAYAKWEQEDSLWVFTIRADRFLRNMVRAIVGTLFETGRGKCTLAGFRTIIEGRNRCLAGPSVPGKGLSLTGIAYPESIFPDNR
jgi:tRNA pseudouridine38-40 synthase